VFRPHGFLSSPADCASPSKRHTGAQRDFLLLTANKTKASLRLCFLPLLVLLSLFCHCSSPKDNSPDVSRTVRQFTDDLGRQVTVASHVDRVVSLAPNLTEIVFAVDAGKLLVGVTSYCDYPPEAQSVEKVGDTLHPSIERIIALRPQVVLVSTASQLENFTRQLDSHQIAVFVTDPHDLEGVFRSIQQVAEILDRKAAGEQLNNTLRARTQKVEESVKSRPRVTLFYQLSDEPLYTAGKDAFVTDLIRRAGGVSVTQEVPGAWPKYSAESALASRPEAIILPTGGSNGAGNSNVADALKRSPAVVAGKVYKINADHLSRPGPRAVDGLEDLARALHPEVFK
jgi:iron complex transport system substrate-binding protein